MTFNDRNNMIDDVIKKYKCIHDRYTSGTKILADDEWRTYIYSMDAIREMYKDTSIAELSGKLCQAFLDDTELVQKKLKENEKS